MKTKIYMIVVLAATIVYSTAQNKNYTIDSLQHFNKNHWLNILSQRNSSPQEKAEYLYAQERQYIRDTYFPTSKLLPQPPTIQQSCTNIDFESGTMSGWTQSTGFHPLYNASGCCPTAGGAQAIMSGAGTDPCGGFPVVAPGGNFSVRVGDNLTGGLADRLEQTFAVTAANANFTYKYAVVFQDPGHTATEQPSFRIDMVDSTGAPIPCTLYNVSAGQGINGFMNSPTCAGVIYKPWSTVIVDLTSYIGQNVTIRFTTFDCALGGHYGYAYIDGSCMSFQQTTTDTICAGTIKNICAPTGFLNYTWNGPGVTNVTAQCVNVAAAGTYTVQTTLVTGCQGPVFYYPILHYPKPLSIFNTSGGNCSPNVGFNNSSTIASGSIVSHDWNFGDGGTSVLQNPTHTYATVGNYNTRLIVNSNKNCSDTAFQPVVINPDPIAAFINNTICQSAPVTFTNTSSTPSGTIVSVTWNFGDGTPVSTVYHPTHIYANAGTYNVTLGVTNSSGCTNSIVQPVTVNAKPNVNFTSANVCFGNANAFNNNSTISSGSISNWFWDFNGDGIIDNTTQNPTNTYPTAGSYSVILNASSNANCISSYSAMVTVYPMPSANFTANNACQGAVTSFNNISTIGGGGQIFSYNWNFGNNTTSGQTNPVLIYSSPNTYSVTLTATSNNNCSSTFGYTVAVYPNPNIFFTSPNVCLGNTNAFSNTSSISNGSIMNWVWDINGDGNADSTSINPSVIYPAAGNYSVSLTGVSNANCVSSYSTVITVHPLPVVNFTGSNTCLGGAVTFTNQSTVANNNMIVAYNWSFGNGATSTIANPQITYGAPGNYNVNLTATSNHNCVNTGTGNVSVYDNPIVNFNSTTTCLNQATQFTNMSGIANGTIIKYRWDFENNGSWDDSTSNPTFIYPVAGTLNCLLEATSNYGCKGSNINSVIVHANPVADFKAQSTCLGDNTTFTNLSNCPDGSLISYMWDFNGDNVMDNGSFSPNHTYAAYGVYMAKLEVQSQFGCVNVISKSVYVNPKPIATFTAKNNVGCPSLCTEFTGSSSIALGSIVTTQWNFGDGSTPSYVKNPTHCYGTGNYSVTLKVVSDSGCIGVFNAPNFVTVYPAPVAGFNVTPDDIDVAEPLINVTSTASGYNSIKYILSDNSIITKENFTHSFNVEEPVNAFVYQEVKNNYGCIDTAVKVIPIKPSFAIYIPNAFTPNADGLNDGFKAQGFGISKFKMWVFDRWGHVIFETEDMNNAWDGTAKGSSEPIKDDVYVWKAEVQDVFNKSHDLTGHVTLIK